MGISLITKQYRLSLALSCNHVHFTNTTRLYIKLKGCLQKSIESQSSQLFVVIRLKIQQFVLNFDA